MQHQNFLQRFDNHLNRLTFLRGQALLAFIMLSFRLFGQSCSPFEFAITKVQPPASSNWRMNTSTTTDPGAFRIIYTVKLKSKTGATLPAIWTLNTLAFNGKITINNVTSRINSTIINSSLFSTPYLQYLDQAALQNGEINWTVGDLNPCDGNGNATSITLHFPQNTTSVDLFYIVVDASPGDQIQFNLLSGTVYDCVTYMCSGQMGINSGITTLVTMPAPPDCGIFPDRKFTFFYGPNGNIVAQLINLIPGQQIAKLDAVFHLTPNMVGISNLDIDVQSIGNQNNPFTLTNLSKRKNANGTFDIYFSLENYTPSASTFNIVGIGFNGQYNLSQGGTFECGLTAGRIAIGDPSFNPATCALPITSSHIILPGYASCDNSLRIDWDNTTNTQDCSGSVNFKITHTSANPIDLTYLKIHLIFKPQGADAIMTPGTLSATLPNPGSGVFSYNTIEQEWEYIYESSGVISLTSGAQISVPFNFQAGCLTYWVRYAEAQYNGATNKCSLGTTAAKNDLCNPKIHGSVVAADNYQNFFKVPQYMVTLRSQNSNDPYQELGLDDCQPQYSFCPDIQHGPFRIIVGTNPNYINKHHCTCGVTTYDLVLISKHLLGIQPLGSPYEMIAANADRSIIQPLNEQSIRASDITAIRNCILGITQDFGPYSSPSWWYVSEGYIFPNPLNPFIAPAGYESAYYIDVPTNGNEDYGNFIAIKTGDVNHSCLCYPLRPEVTESSSYLKAEFGKITKDNTLSVSIWSDAPFNLAAAQAGFRFDASLYRLKAIIPNSDLPIKEENFGLTYENEGELRFAWFPFDGVTSLPKHTLLFTLQFEMKNAISLDQNPMLWVSDKVLQSVVYSESGDEIPVKLNWKGVESDNNKMRVVVGPNPFETSLSTYIYVEHAGTAFIQLPDSKGIVQKEEHVNLISGDNAIEIQADIHIKPGVYFISIDFDGQKIQKRVVKL